MKKLLFFILGIIFLASCSKISSDQELPEWEALKPQTMVTQLPVVNIEADQAQLSFLFTNFDDPIQIPSTITIYGVNKDVLVRNNAILEIKGVGSAAQDMKPIGFVLEQPFNNGEKGLLQPHTTALNDDLSAIQTLRLRNSSQDYGITMLKDLAFTELALRAGFDFELKYGRPTHLFVNSEYYGLHNLRTEVDRMGLSHLLNVDSNDITILKMDSDNHNLEYRDGDAAFAESFIQAIKSEDLITLKRNLDIENFMDYIIYQDYVGNTDWPHNNARAYSVNGSQFRFLLYDLDKAVTLTNNPIIPRMEYMEDHISRIYQILLAQDEGFVERFEIRKNYWYERLSPQLFNTIVDELARDIVDEIPYLIARRGVPESNFHWELNLEQLKRAMERRDKNNRKKYQLR